MHIILHAIISSDYLIYMYDDLDCKHDLWYQGLREREREREREKGREGGRREREGGGRQVCRWVNGDRGREREE